MKKILCILALAAFAVGGSLFAAGKGGFVSPNQGGKGGFNAPAGQKINSVTEVMTLSDDVPVVLKGFIVESLGDDKYRFKDHASDATIIVEIDEDEWNGQVVTTEDLIVIVGEVDRDRNSVKVDAKRVHKAGGPMHGKGGPRGGDKAAAGCTNCGCASSAPAKN